MTFHTAILPKAPVRDTEDAHQVARYAEKFSPSGLDYQSTFGRQDIPLSRSAYQFNGVDTAMVSDIAGIQIGTADRLILIEGWVLPTNSASGQIFACIALGAGSISYISLGFSSSGGYAINMGSTVGDLGNYVSSIIPVEAVWVKFKLEDNGGDITLTIGDEVDLVSYTPATSTIDRLGLGAQTRNTNNNFSSSSVVDVTFTLGTASVNNTFRFLCQEQAGNVAYDISGNGNHGTIQGDLANLHIQSPDIPVLHRGNREGYSRGLYLDGANYGQTADDTLSQVIGTANLANIEFEMIVINSKPDNEGIWNFGTFQSSQGIMACSILPTTKDIAIRLGGGAFANIPGADYNVNETINVRFEYDGTKWRSYLNGQFKSEQTIAASVFPAGEVFTVGGYFSSGFVLTNAIIFYVKGSFNGQEYFNYDFRNASGLTVRNTGANAPTGTDLTLQKDLYPIVPAVSKILDAIGGRLTNPGSVRQLTRIKNVNVGQFDGVATVQLSQAPPAGFTFSYDGTSTINIDVAGLITGTSGNVNNLKIFDGGTLVSQLTFNEGAGTTVFDIVGGNDGTWVNATDPNQWGKSDDAVDTFLQRGLKPFPVATFNGSTSIVTIGNDPSLTFDDGRDFSITGWYAISPDIVWNNRQAIIMQGASSDSAYSYTVTLRSAVQIRFQVRNAAGTSATVNLADPPVGEPFFFAARYSTSSIDFTVYFQNGTTWKTGSTPNPPLPDRRPSDDIWIGKGIAAVSFDGELWDIQFHDKVLDAGEIESVRIGSILSSVISRWRLDGIDFTDSVGSNDGTPTDVGQDTIFLEQTNTQGRFFDTGSLLDFLYYNALDSRLPSNYSLGGNITGPLYIQGNERVTDATPTPEATAVLARYSALTDVERNAITLFVNNLVAFNIYDKIDEFYCFALNATDWLIGFKNKTALNTNSVKTNKGAQFNGVDAFIDTQFNPAIDGVAYQSADAMAGIFISEKVADGPFSTLFGATQGTTAVFQMGSNVGRPYLINDTSTSETQSEDIGDNTWATLVRNGNQKQVFLNGAISDNNPRAANGFPNNSVYVGDRNRNGSADSASFQGTVASFLLSGAVGIDQSILFALHDEFLKNLGVIETEPESTEEEDFVVQQDLATGDALARINNFIKSGFNQLPVRLTAEEEAALEKFKRNEGLYGNWDKIDAIWIFSLISEANTLFDIKGFRQATNVDATRVRDGFEILGSQRIDTNFNALQDGVNYQLNDALGGGYIVKNRATGSDRSSLLATGSGNRFQLVQQLDNARLQFYVNSAGRNYTGESQFADVSLYHAVRTDASNIALYKNGEVVSAQTISVASVPDATFKVNQEAGALGVVSSAIIGAAINFNQLAHYDNLTTLLGELQAAHVVNDSLFVWSQSDITALNEFAAAEFKNTNWQAYATTQNVYESTSTQDFVDRIEAFAGVLPNPAEHITNLDAFKQATGTT